MEFIAEVAEAAKVTETGLHSIQPEKPFVKESSECSRGSTRFGV
jgi:hypothetical protein